MNDTEHRAFLGLGMTEKIAIKEPESLQKLFVLELKKAIDDGFDASKIIMPNQEVESFYFKYMSTKASGSLEGKPKKSKNTVML